MGAGGLWRRGWPVVLLVSGFLTIAGCQAPATSSSFPHADPADVTRAENQRLDAPPTDVPQAGNQQLDAPPAGRPPPGPRPNSRGFGDPFGVGRTPEGKAIGAPIKLPPGGYLGNQEETLQEAEARIRSTIQQQCGGCIPVRVEYTEPSATRCGVVRVEPTWGSEVSRDSEVVIVSGTQSCDGSLLQLGATSDPPTPSMHRTWSRHPRPSSTSDPGPSTRHPRPSATAEPTDQETSGSTNGPDR
jgi:hypothetical protein